MFTLNGQSFLFFFMSVFFLLKKFFFSFREIGLTYFFFVFQDKYNLYFHINKI